jgi:type I restriction enzyme R subunit
MFNEENTVEQMVLDTLCGGVTSNVAVEYRACHAGESNRNQGGLLHGI